MNNKVVVSAILCFVLLCIAYYLDHNSTFYNFWQNQPLGTAGEFAEYCEHNRMNSLLRQQMNSYSNIGFIFVGFLLIFSCKEVGRLSQFFTIFYSIFLIILGIGSTYYHASLTIEGQRWDMLGTYGIPLSALILSIQGIIAPNNRTFLSILTIVLLFFLVGYFISPFYNLSSKILPPVFIATAIFTSMYIYKNPHKSTLKTGIVAILSLAAAVFFRTIDVKKIGCDPESLYQGHALWHLLTATSAYLVYRIYHYTYSR